MLFRYIRGFCLCKITGDTPEKFINLLSQKHIGVWDVKAVSDYEFTFCVSYFSRKKVIGFARDKNYEIALEKSVGLPLFLYKNRVRCGLVVGALIFSVLIFLMKSCVWSIEIEGNHTLSDDEIIAALSEAGLKEGSIKSKLNLRNIRQKLRLKLKGVSYVELNLEGSKAKVSVIEANPKEEKINPPCNLVSKCDGVITRMEITCGEGRVEVGDTVKKGQLLASGIADSPVKGFFLLPAQGRVFASRTEKLEAFIPYRTEYFERTGEYTEKYRLKLFNFYIKLYIGTGKEYPFYDKIYNYKELKIFDCALPIGLEKTTYYEKTGKTKTLSENEAKDIARLRLEGMERERFIDSDVKSKRVTESVTKSGVLIKGYYTVVEDIAERQIIETD